MYNLFNEKMFLLTKKMNFLAFVFFTFLLFFSSFKYSLAQTGPNFSCRNVRITPTIGTPTTVFTLEAFECELNTGMSIWDSGLEHYFSNPSVPLFPNSNGNIVFNFTPPPGYLEGSHTITIFQQSNKIYNFANIQINITPSTTDPKTLRCGDLGKNPFTNGGVDECPIDCPFTTSLTGSAIGGGYLNVCSCGIVPFPCCAPGNTGGVPSCIENGAVCNSATQKCEVATTQLEFTCGDVIPPPNVSNSVCIGGCPKVPTKDNPSVYWCACGTPPNACCPAGGPRPVCESGFICKLNACQVPDSDDLPGYVCASDKDAIYTALGCFRMPDLNALMAFAIKAGAGWVGGIGVLLMLFSFLKIILSKGDPYGLQDGRDMLTSAIIGIALVIFCVFLLRVIGVNILGII